MLNEVDIVMKGKWLDVYNNQEKKYTIAIIKSEVEVSVEVYENSMMKCYRILFMNQSSEQKDKFIYTISEQHFFDIEEACQKAEEMTKQKIRWEVL